MMKRLSVVVTAMAALGLSLSACGGDDGGGDDSSSTNTSAEGSSNAGNSGSSNRTSTLVVDGEELEVTSGGMCSLEPQDVAGGGGGQILATAQIRATNAAGQDVMLDFSRYDADSQFHGDSVEITLGNYGDDGWLTGSFDEGTVSVSGDVVSADDLNISDTAAGLSSVISFEIECW